MTKEELLALIHSLNDSKCDFESDYGRGLEDGYHMAFQTLIEVLEKEWA